jgi:glycosyltransferase involved in cell wall biosynthesis
MPDAKTTINQCDIPPVLLEPCLLLEAGCHDEAGQRFLDIVSDFRLQNNVFQASLRVIGLIKDDEILLNILTKIREPLCNRLLLNPNLIAQALSSLGYQRQNTEPRLRLLSEHFVAFLANLAYGKDHNDIAFFLEQMIYFTFVKNIETEKAFNFAMELTRESASRAGRRAAKLIGQRDFDFSNSHPIIGFFFHNASMLAHIANIHEYLKSAHNKGYADFTPIVFCLGGRDSEFEKSFSDIDVRVIYLDVLWRDERTKVHSVTARLFQLRKICEHLKVDKIVWGCLASFMPFAFNMRIAKEQIWWSQKWQNFGFDGLDKRIYSFNKNFVQTHYGERWYCGWFQRKSWLEPTTAEDIKKIRDQFAGKIILGSLSRTEKMHNTEFLDTVSQILLNNDNVVYLWAGRDQDPKIQQHFIDSGVDNKAEFIGWVHTSTYAQAIDIFLDTFPAGCGVTAIQAMEAGKPIVSHKCTDEVKSLDMLFSSFFEKEQSPMGSRANIATLKDDVANFAFSSDKREYVKIVKQLIDNPDYRKIVGDNYKGFVSRNFCSPDMAESRFTQCLLIDN